MLVCSCLHVLLWCVVCPFGLDDSQCALVRTDMQPFFQFILSVRTFTQVNTHKNLLSHAARRAIVIASARIPGRTRPPKRSRQAPRPNARIPTRKRARLPTYAHTRLCPHVRAHLRPRERAPARRGGGEGQITTPPPATQRVPSDFFTRTKLEPVTELLRNGGTPKYPSPR